MTDFVDSSPLSHTHNHTQHLHYTHQAEAQVQQSAATSSFEWRGQVHPVRHERVRVALHSAGELAAALDASSGAAGAGDSMEVGGKTPV